MAVREPSIDWHYYDGKCYGLRYNQDSWEGSQGFCASMGGHLTKMESQEEMEFLRSKWGGYNFWLGARDVVTEGSWVWHDGSPLTWTYWGGSNPDGQTTENCVLWIGGGSQFWSDVRCSQGRRSVCSLKVSQQTESLMTSCLLGLSRSRVSRLLLLAQRPLWTVGRRL